MPLVITPYQLICPSVVATHFDIQLDDHAIQLSEARNDCFCHIAKNRKLIPLDKIQDIQVGQDCCQSCFGVKVVSILTGGSGTEDAAFLDSPDEVRAGISLAARLVQTRAAAAPNSMGGTLRSRIAALDALVARGALTRDELAAARVPLLAEERDPASLLTEAAGLRDAGALSPSEVDSSRPACSPGSADPAAVAARPGRSGRAAHRLLHQDFNLGRAAAAPRRGARPEHRPAENSWARGCCRLGAERGDERSPRAHCAVAMASDRRPSCAGERPEIRTAEPARTAGPVVGRPVGNPTAQDLRARARTCGPALRPRAAAAGAQTGGKLLGPGMQQTRSR